jgi:carboxyl-terminal processing protease
MVKQIQESRVFRLWLLCALVIPIGLARAEPPKDDAPSSLSDTERQKNLESFEFVWETIRDKHWDPKLNGLNWQAIHDELKPKVAKAADMGEVRAVMSDMLARLKQSHFAILPGDTVKAVGNKTNGEHANVDEGTGGPGVTGIDVRIVDDQALVVSVEPKSPAAKAGVKPGWQIVKIRDKEVAPIIAKVKTTFKDSTYLELLLSRAVVGRLHGSIGGKVNIVFRDGDDKETALDVGLATPQGTVSGFGLVNGLHVHFEARRMEPNIGYLALNTFFDPVSVMPRLEKAMRDFHEADGIILDLRGNPGGLAAMGVGFGNWFIQTPDLKLGTMSTRDTELNFVLNPRLEPYLGPLAILVDGGSASTSEFLAGGLQDLKRARIFGTRTAGAALPSSIVRLPNGDGFQYAVANYVSAGGQALEGRGVRPDVEVAPKRATLLAGHDPVIDAAVEWIKGQKK